MNEKIKQANGWLLELQPLVTLSNLLALIGAALILWGMVSKMETRITQNEQLLQEVRGEVKELTDVNRRLEALEEAEIAGRVRMLELGEAMQDYLGTRSITRFRLDALEREVRSLKSADNASP